MASIDEMNCNKLLDLLAPVNESSFWLQSVDFYSRLSLGVEQQVLTIYCKIAGRISQALLGPVTTTKQEKSAVPKEFAVAMIAVLHAEKYIHSRLQKLQNYFAAKLWSKFYKAPDDVSHHVLVDRFFVC